MESKKVKGVIHWVSSDSIECIFELVSSLVKNNEFNKDSLIRKKGFVEEYVIKNKNNIFQFERVGFFKFDRYDDKIPVFIQVIGLTSSYTG